MYLWNRTHVSASTGMTPYEAVTKREPSILHVGVFGCDAFVHQDRTQRDVDLQPEGGAGHLPRPRFAAELRGGAHATHGQDRP